MLNNLPNLNELYCFTKIAEHGSFTKTATALNVTPSALSQNMKNLESSLNVRLFNRTTRSLSLTEAGAQLLADIQPHFAAISDGIGRLNELRENAFGTIRINTSQFAADHLLYPKLKPLLQAHPQMKLELMIENRWVDIVAEGFDMGVRLGYAVYKDMIAVKISEPMKIVLVASPDYLKGRKIPESVEDLDSHELIGMRLSNAHNEDEWEFTHQGQHISYTPKPRFSVNSNLRLNAAIDGLGIAWLPEQTVRDAIAKGELVELMPDYAHTYSPFYLYYPSRKGNGKMFREVVEVLKV